MNTIYKIVLVIFVILVLLIVAIVMLRHRRNNIIVGGGQFRLKVSDPEYTAMLNGEKTIEARLDRPPFNKLAVGNHIIVIRSRPKDDTSEYPGGKYKYKAEIVRINKYKNLEALLKGEGIAKVYPGKKTVAEATERFSMHLPPDTSAADPVIAIELRAITDKKK